ncbi:MAG: FxsA family protein [Alteromonadaceae bacterium]|nr:FxsA family protein [Alteromonadaceae bacterium]
MFRILFVFFVIVPIIEITVLMHIGAWLGVWPTIAIVVLTAWLGAKNVRQQGLATLSSVQTKMAQGEVPSNEIIAGVMLIVAGVLLVTPGFVTDAFGLSLLVPAVRQSLINTVKQHFVVNQMSQSSFGFHSSSSSTEHSINESSINHHETSGRSVPPNKGDAIEGEFERKD